MSNAGRVAQKAKPQNQKSIATRIDKHEKGTAKKYSIAEIYLGMVIVAGINISK